jgi:predicted enzyme related to lactoylglutathione lyase
MAHEASSFIWYELMTDDLAAAEAFYTSVVGWTVASSGQPGMDYRIWSAAGRGVGGLMAIPAEAAGMKPGWFGYLKVADVDASVAGVVAAGGSVGMPANDIPGVGRIAMVSDPQGAAFYVMTPKMGEAPHPVAQGRPGHGAWHELHAKDARAALAFYGAAFGWGAAGEMDMGPMGSYLMFNTGADPVGGMMASAALGKPAWLFYFGVGDIDAAKARVEAAGGTVTNGPQEVPGGMWVVQGLDPRGAAFAVVGSRKG